MMLKKSFKALSIIPLLTAVLTADEKTTELKTHTELSYVNTSGNSYTETLSVKLEFDKHFDKVNQIKGKGEGIYSKTESEDENTGVTEEDIVANKLYLEAEYDYNLEDSSFFAFVKSDYINDKFSGYDYRLNIGPGLGYKIPIKNDDHSLDLSISIQYSQNKADQKGSKADSYSSGKTALKHLWNVKQGTKFKQSLSYQTSFDDSENYFIESITGIEIQLTDMLSLGSSYKVNYQHLLPTEEAVHTDKIFLTSLIIDY
jgi:putative salt-induced outer membrane protein